MTNRSNFPMPSSHRPAGREPEDDVFAGFDEDPLVELARIVSEGTGTRNVSEPHLEDPASAATDYDYRYDAEPAGPTEADWSANDRDETDPYQETSPLEDAEHYPFDPDEGYGEESATIGRDAPHGGVRDTYYGEEALAAEADRLGIAPDYAADHDAAASAYAEDPALSARYDQDVPYQTYDAPAHEPTTSHVPNDTLAADLTAGLEDELRSAVDAGVGEQLASQFDTQDEDLFEESGPAAPYQPTAYAEEEQPAAFAEEDEWDHEVEPAYASPAYPSSVAAPYGAAEGYDYDYDEEPPAEGYDIDAVARAMHESDPALFGHGVLPPHSAAEEAAAPEGRRRRGFMAAAVVGGLVVVGGGALAMMNIGGGEADAGPPPVIVADAGPLKVYPEPVETDAQPQSKLIYERVGGVTQPHEERLVVQETPPVASLPPAPVDATAPTAANTPASPRRVRTVVVRPDGSIIEAEDADNTADTLPSPTPSESAAAIPQLPTSDASGEQNGAESAPELPAQDVTTAAATPSAPEDDPQVPETPPPSASADGGDSVPKPKPTDVPVRVAAAPAATDSATAATTRSASSGPLDLTSSADQPTRTAAVPAAASATVPSGAYLVQVSSQRTEQQAQTAFADLQRRFPTILGNATPVIQRADLGEKGTFYRVRIASSSREEAERLCNNLKSAGGDCFVRRN